MQLEAQDPSSSVRELTIPEFIKEYHPTLTREAIAYARRAGKIDSIKKGTRVFVQLTETTLSYKPNLYKEVRVG